MRVSSKIKLTLMTIGIALLTMCTRLLYLMWRCSCNTCYSPDPYVEQYVEQYVEATPIPEPSTMWLIGVAFVCYIIYMIKLKGK